MLKHVLLALGSIALLSMSALDASAAEAPACQDSFNCPQRDAANGSCSQTRKSYPQNIEDKINLLVEESDRWWHKGDYPQCIRCNEAIVALDPSWVEIYSNTAWLQWSMGQDVRALRTLHRAIAANPRSWEARFNMGLHRFNIHEYDRAEKYLAQAVALGGDKQARKMYAYSLEQNGKQASALAVWRGLRHDFPKDSIIRTHADRAEAAAKAKQQ